MNNDINEVKKDDSKAKRIIKLIGKIITYLFILLIVYVVLKVVVGFATKTPPKIFNHFTFTVMTPSMEPDNLVDDIVFVRSTTIDKVKDGDVISFICTDISMEVYGQTIVHKAIKIENNNGSIEITTKGINNPLADNEKVTKINFIGIVDAKSTMLGKVYKSLISAYAIIYVFGLIVILKITQDAIKKIKEVKKEKENNLLKEQIKKNIIDSINQENYEKK